MTKTAARSAGAVHASKPAGDEPAVAPAAGCLPGLDQPDPAENQEQGDKLGQAAGSDSTVMPTRKPPRVSGS